MPGNEFIVKNELDSMYGISDEELTERLKEAFRIDYEIRRIKRETVWYIQK